MITITNRDTGEVLHFSSAIDKERRDFFERLPEGQREEIFQQCQVFAQRMEEAFKPLVAAVSRFAQAFRDSSQESRHRPESFRRG